MRCLPAVVVLGILFGVPAVASTIPDPVIPRQGGESIADAVQITFPCDVSGTTTGHADDFNEYCPYSYSTAPDVVYTFAPEADQAVTFDMLGSAYDTKIYLYNEDLLLIACDNDGNPDGTSLLSLVEVEAGIRHYLIIDGSYGSHGDYVCHAENAPLVTIPCPPGAQEENEPPLVFDYHDAWNGGCDSPEFGSPFQSITGDVFCGRAGRYQASDGTYMRDTDWFTVTIPAGGVLEITADADERTFMAECAPQDCAQVWYVQSVVFGAFSEQTMTVTGPAGSQVWIWVAPTTDTGPLYDDYSYILRLNLTTPVEPHSWTTIKRMFD